LCVTDAPYELQADSVVPDPYDSQSWDRFAYGLNNPVRYVDPSGHRTCTDQQAATGDETCEQNYNADNLQQALDFFYGWKIAGEWTVEELVLILEAGKSIREFIAVNTGEDGNLWIKTYLGNTVFHHGNDIRSFVFASSDAYLRNGEEHYWVIHELGHVLDNNFKSGGAPATFFGGGAADAMLKFVGGNPENCFPRFQCSSSYIKDIAGPESWGQGEYGNNSVADDFAETFARVTTNGIAPTLRSVWMKAFLSVLASYVP
jgi:hypothetical protein